MGDSCFPGQGVNAVVFSGFSCAHRAMCDLGLVPSWPAVDKGFQAMIRMARLVASKMGEPLTAPQEEQQQQQQQPAPAPQKQQQPQKQPRRTPALQRAAMPQLLSNVLPFPFAKAAKPATPASSQQQLEAQMVDATQSLD